MLIQITYEDFWCLNIVNAINPELLQGVRNKEEHLKSAQGMLVSTSMMIFPAVKTIELLESSSFYSFVIVQLKSDLNIQNIKSDCMLF